MIEVREKKISQKMTREEVVEQLLSLENHCLEMAKNGSDEWKKDVQAIGIAAKSVALWDSFIERLAERCNESRTSLEWNTYRKAIELIKAEFDEKIG